MKAKHINHKGFTLIELLVVIGIIAVIASISIPVSLRALNIARETVASTAIKDINAAINDYKDDYYAIPVGIMLNQESALTSDSDPTDQTAAVATNCFDKFIAALTGETAGNEREKRYLQMNDCKSPDDASCREGLTRDAAGGVAHGILDPWGNPYFIQLDSDLDNTVTLAINSTGITGTTGYEGEIRNLGGNYAFLISGGRDTMFTMEDTDVVSHE